MRMPSRRLFSVAILGLAAIAAFTFPRLRVASAKPARAIDAAPGDPQLIDLAGYQDVVAKYHGKALFVTFWATWCQPCRTEFPTIVSLAKEYAPKGLVVVGVSLDEEADMKLVRQFLVDNRPDFPNYRQKPGIDSDAFYRGVNPEWSGTLPQNDFYARDGHLARYLVGEKQKDAFVQAIRLVLATPVAENRPNAPSRAGN
jgi:thiol-disulfide isomerase/thioredoxin